MSGALKILLYGFGNPGRRDDGLGIEFVNRIEEWVKQNHLTGFEFETNYQLNIEDAELIADKDLVIFADASIESIEDFCVTEVISTFEVTFSTHSASPGYILKLCNDLFGKHPTTLLVHIKGYDWELGEGLTLQAGENLEKACNIFKAKLLNPSLLIEQGTSGFKSC